MTSRFELLSPLSHTEHNDRQEVVGTSCLLPAILPATFQPYAVTVFYQKQEVQDLFYTSAIHTRIYTRTHAHHARRETQVFIVLHLLLYMFKKAIFVIVKGSEVGRKYGRKSQIDTLYGRK